MPTKEEIFSDAQSVGEHGDRLEALKSALAKAIERHDKGVDGFLSAKQAEKMGRPAGIQRGAGPGSVNTARRLEEMAARVSTFSKGLSEDEQKAITEDLEVLKTLQGEVSKDITTTSPGNLHPYDLEAPAKILVPRFTPLRNRMTRSRGQGTAVEYRRILGYTNTGMGGVADQSPFFNSESDSADPTFGTLALRRGQKIAYAMDVHTAAYMEMSLSDMVTWKAQFANLGFEDSRQLSQMALLWSHLLGEEKALLYGRGASGAGYEGAVAAPVIAAPTAGGTGGTIPAATYFARLTAKAGYGESVPSAVVASVAVTLGQNVTITLTGGEPVGALSYNAYLGTTSGSEKFQGNFVPSTTGGVTTITLSAFNGAGANVPAADTTSNANAYDGYLTVLADPAQSGFVGRVNAPLWNGTTGNGDKVFQDAFASLFASVYADPEEIWFGAPQRRELTDWIKSANGGAAAYRLQVNNDSFNGGMTVSGLVTGIVNESSPTGRIVDLNVHPYMPSGAAFINSRVLPIPDSHIGESVEVREVQPYMAVDWPQIQFTYDSSTYWFGTMVHYAPKWSAALLGIQ